MLTGSRWQVNRPEKTSLSAHVKNYDYGTDRVKLCLYVKILRTAREHISDSKHLADQYDKDFKNHPWAYFRKQIPGRPVTIW